MNIGWGPKRKLQWGAADTRKPALPDSFPSRDGEFISTADYSHAIVLTMKPQSGYSLKRQEIIPEVIGTRSCKRAEGILQVDVQQDGLYKLRLRRGKAAR